MRERKLSLRDIEIGTGLQMAEWLVQRMPKRYQMKAGWIYTKSGGEWFKLEPADRRESMVRLLCLNGLIKNK